MNYWWVNHSQTYREERTGNYIWSPQKNKNGTRNQMYTNLTKVRAGDVIFSYANGVIGSVGVAEDTYSQCDRPASFGTLGEQWDKNGWKVPVNWFPLDRVISPKEHFDQISVLLPDKYSPLQRHTGHGNQGCYLAAISPELGELLVFLAIRAGNTGISDLLRDMAETIDENKEVTRLNADRSLPETTREALIKARIGQGLFRENVEASELGCRVTGVTDKRFLVASHIKPWRVGSNDERLDGANGLILSPHIDKLFDHGWISFADDGDLLIAPSCPRDVITKWNVASAVAKRAFSAEQKKYLAYHREYIFDRRVGRNETKVSRK